MSSVFTVTGETRFYDVLLDKDLLDFESNSKLILGPVEGHDDAPRTLTIVAKEIRIKDQAEITYDLDGRSGNDPYTPAPDSASTASKGSDGYTHPGEGSYPIALDGGNGESGGRGEKGISGINAPTLEIWVEEVTEGSMKINLKGQDGGKGGNGGGGGNGGNGQKGAKSTVTDAWYNGDECSREPGKGGDGGKGGDAGYPGEGGHGGNGGIVKVFTLNSYLPRVQGWTYIVEGGKGGACGEPGRPGEGGKGGSQGDKVGPCPERSEYRGRDGPDGKSMDDIDSSWRTNFRGKDGRDGEYATYKVEKLPH